MNRLFEPRAGIHASWTADRTKASTLFTSQTIGLALA